MRNNSSYIALGVSERAMMTDIDKMHHLDNIEMPDVNLSESALIRDLNEMNLARQE